jgi:hypothetical protein
MPIPPETENSPGSKNIEDVMGPEERQATGLSHLSHVELQKLNAWLDTNIDKLGRSRGRQAPGPANEIRNR